ncbi:MAG TPA: V-type ATPase subunit [Candidatus Lachnoclostridium pullistercoris]|uniref:V-type ATPase subunit n=1 Tax=Candidatus Lachnoclostridium pullistercoris TaxID=2838632 RepID=A0A9D2PAH8_9FIRM|nr:V-type ATPase subunit [Candidatus Lachnoclostridium pullistercoris]
MAENQYLYEVARIRTKELSLLSADFFEQLLSAPDYEACIRLLREKGWEGGRDDWEEMLAKEREKTWKLMEELVGDTSVFDVFLYGNDYSNLKAAVKSCRHRTELSNIYISQGTVPADIIRKALQENRFEDLPEAMREPAREAQRVLLQTGDGQLCDIIIDRAALEAIYRAGRESGNEFLKLYGELTVACADIKTAVRACRTGKSREFLERALAPCDSLNVRELADAAASGAEAVEKYLETTEYREGAGELKESLSAFERWCDNLLIRRIRPQLYNAFGLGPLAAYILARESEIKSVRIVLSGKKNHLPEESIRERVRETYV